MIGVDERVTTEEEIAESLHKEYVHEKVREEIYEGDNAEKDAEAKQRILYYTYAGMAMGFVPFPLLDLAALAALQLRMLHRLSQIYEVEFKAGLGRSASSSLVGGVAPVISAAPVAASLSKFIPGVGHILSYGTLLVLNGASTYAVGKVFARHFASGGTFLTFDPEAARDYFAEQYEKGKEVVTSLKKKKKKKGDAAE
ncbi:MAG: DUF697 domain-containing protein [Candidatus Electrothrix communis]|nr:DUF697 domain-containing protein [Desulfobulbus sp. US4]WLE97512.1 MAG: DUF697 domain-containing protein [Candidatus Electrothrix communis]